MNLLERKRDFRKKDYHLTLLVLHFMALTYMRRWIGVLLYAIIFFVFVWGVYMLIRRYLIEYGQPAMAVLISMMILSVFDNMLPFAPIVFTLIFAIVIALLINRVQ